MPSKNENRTMTTDNAKCICIGMDMDIFRVNYQCLFLKETSLNGMWERWCIIWLASSSAVYYVYFYASCALSLSLTFSIQRCNRISNYFIERSIESSVSSYWDCHVNYLYRHHINANTHTLNWGDRDREKEWASTVKCQQIMNWFHYPHSILSLEVSLKFNFQ